MVMPLYLIDTNVCILAIAGREPDASFLRQAIERDAVAISVITVAEFLSRALAAERRAFERLLAVFPVLEISETTARLAAQYRKRSLKKSRVSLLDCLLAAQAREHNLAIVTNNVTDFPMRDIKIIKPKV